MILAEQRGSGCLSDDLKGKVYSIMPLLKDGLYALYLRKSRADLEREKFGQFETLVVHEHELVALAKREGYILDKPYYKELVSGEHIADRLEFQKLMQKVNMGVYQGILVHEVSRLGRGEAMEYGYVLFTLRRTGTLVITPTRSYDPRNPDDFRALQMEMFLSNMELGNIRWRLANGSRARAEMGCFVKSRAPYGYDRIRINGYWTLEQNDDAPTVRLMYERRAAGVPYGTIARDLNDAGIRTPSGGLWSASRIHAIVSNPVYMGMIRYGYYRNELIPTDGFNYIRKQTINEDYILVPGLHEAIVSKELWHAANDRHSKDAPVKHSRELKNPLAGLIVCKNCGRSMIRSLNRVPSSGNIIEHYRHAAFAECDNKAQGARVSVVIDVLCDALDEIANDLEAREIVGDPDTRENELAAIKKQLAQEEKRLDKLMDLYFADAITIDEFKERREASEELREALQSRIEALQGDRPSLQEVAFTIREAITKLRDESVDARAKNTALKSFIEKIEFENFTKPRSRDYDIRLNIILKS